MKKALLIVVALMVASGVMAQGLGITVADTAAPAEVGQLSVKAGITIGTGDAEVTLFGARAEYSPVDNLLILLGVGLADFDGSDDSVIGIDAAVQCALTMLDLPVDLAVRGGYSRVVPEFAMGAVEMDLSSLNVLLIISSDLEAVEGLALYGGAGYWLALDSDIADNEIILVFGGQFAILDTLDIFAEYAILDEGFLSAGAAFDF